MRLRVTLIAEYDANPDHYGTDDPNEMAAIDAASLNDDPFSIMDFIQDEADIKVEAVQER